LVFDLMASESGFLPAKARKRRKGKEKARVTFSDKLARTNSEINCETWLEGYSDDLLRELQSGHVKDILCLGLGSPSNSLVARAQLVLLLRLQQLILVRPSTDRSIASIYPNLT